MPNVTLLSGVSNYLTEARRQWDSGQVLTVNGFNYTGTPTLHFANKKATKALIVDLTREGNALTAPIPNSLLREPYDILAYLYVTDGDDARTRVDITIPVNPRVEPDDYVYTEDEGLVTLQAINDKAEGILDATNKRAAEILDETEAAIDQALDDLKNFVVPVATETALGGVKAEAATEEDTVPVHIKADGTLAVKAPVNNMATVTLTAANWVTGTTELTQAFTLDGVVDGMKVDIIADTGVLTFLENTDGILIRIENSDGNLIAHLTPKEISSVSVTEDVTLTLQYYEVK